MDATLFSFLRSFFLSCLLYLFSRNREKTLLNDPIIIGRTRKLKTLTEVLLARQVTPYSYTV